MSLFVDFNHLQETPAILVAALVADRSGIVNSQNPVKKVVGSWFEPDQAREIKHPINDGK